MPVKRVAPVQELNPRSYEFEADENVVGTGGGECEDDDADAGGVRVFNMRDERTGYAMLDLDVLFKMLPQKALELAARYVKKPRFRRSESVEERGEKHERVVLTMDTPLSPRTVAAVLLDDAIPEPSPNRARRSISEVCNLRSSHLIARTLCLHPVTRFLHFTTLFFLLVLLPLSCSFPCTPSTAFPLTCTTLLTLSLSTHIMTLSFLLLLTILTILSTHAHLLPPPLPHLQLLTLLALLLPLSLTSLLLQTTSSPHQHLLNLTLSLVRILLLPPLFLPPILPQTLTTLRAARAAIPITLLLLLLHIIFASLGIMIFWPTIPPDNLVDDESNNSLNEILSWLALEEQRTSAFPTYGQAVYTMFKLLTTVNYPDVMLPSLGADVLYSLYWIAYMVLTVYGVLCVVFALVFDGYAGQRTKENVYAEMDTAKKATLCARAIVKYARTRRSDQHEEEQDEVTDHRDDDDDDEGGVGGKTAMMNRMMKCEEEIGDDEVVERDVVRDVLERVGGTGGGVFGGLMISRRTRTALRHAYVREVVANAVGILRGEEKDEGRNCDDDDDDFDDAQEKETRSENDVEIVNDMDDSELANGGRRRERSLENGLNEMVSVKQLRTQLPLLIELVSVVRIKRLNLRPAFRSETEEEDEEEAKLLRRMLRRSKRVMNALLWLFWKRKRRLHAFAFCALFELVVHAIIIGNAFSWAFQYDTVFANWDPRTQPFPLDVDALQAFALATFCIISLETLFKSASEGIVRFCLASLDGFVNILTIAFMSYELALAARQDGFPFEGYFSIMLTPRLATTLLRVPQFSRMVDVLRATARWYFIDATMLLVYALLVFTEVCFWLFGGRLYIENDVLNETAYAANNYWPLNCNSYARCLNVAFALLVNNNWTNIVSAFDAVFRFNYGTVIIIAWWMVSQLLLLNVLTSTVTEAFLMHYELTAAERQRSARHVVNRMLRVLELSWIRTSAQCALGEEHEHERAESSPCITIDSRGYRTATVRIVQLESVRAKLAPNTVDLSFKK